jgi:hypothetical protein
MAFDLTDALAGLAGGLMIGAAAALFLLVNGRIAGVSGLVAGLGRPGKAWAENAAFVLGLVAAPLGYAAVAGAPAIGTPVEPLLLVAGGLLVGIGTAMGAGCTSGHGVCGMTRLSPRSLAATGVFMAVAVAVATLLGTGG